MRKWKKVRTLDVVRLLQQQMTVFFYPMQRADGESGQTMHIPRGMRGGE
jgi:hypothetical protein